MNLLDQINELESWIGKRDLCNQKVSQTTIGWQIAHALKVANSIVKVLAKSDPEEYKWKFNIYRALFMTLKVFPRGSAKAPRAVQPEEIEISAEGLNSLLHKVRTRIDSIKQGIPNTFFEHPYFGQLNRDQSISFIGIHTFHHLKIIRDIAKK